VLVSGLTQATAVTLTASLGAVMRTATVRVLGAAELPTSVTLSPSSATITPGASQTLTATLDLPAPVGGTVVALSLAPAAAGTVPATVTVPAGQISATFTYVDASMVASAMVTATLGATSSTPPSPSSRRSATWSSTRSTTTGRQRRTRSSSSSCYNPTTQPIDLTGKALVLVNGSSTPAPEYRRVALASAGSLPAGGYLVIGAAAVTPMGAGLKLTPPVGSGAAQWPATDAIQNGSAGVSAPGDGLLVVDTTTMTVFDRLSYESAVTVNDHRLRLDHAGRDGMLTTAGDDPTAAASMVRIPNGADTNNALADWAMTANLTPGIANVP
jgi:hypothetical protein